MKATRAAFVLAVLLTAAIAAATVVAAVAAVAAVPAATAIPACSAGHAAAAQAPASSGGRPAYEKHLEVRTSRIPHAGNGVFTRVAIPKGAVLGAYTGEFITEDEYRRRLAADRWQYMMGLLDCVKPHTGGLLTIDGIEGNAFTRMNYAPAEFQNVKFEKICTAPFVRIVALRDIAAGEELWVDYGPNYRYDFMQDAAVLKFFADLRARREGKAAKTGLE